MDNFIIKAKKKNMCVYGPPTDPKHFRVLTLNGPDPEHFYGTFSRKLLNTLFLASRDGCLGS